VILRSVFGTPATIAGTVYGTIVVLAVVAAGGKAFEQNLWQLVAIVVTTVLVLWLAHVYADGLGESLRAGRRLTAGEIQGIARRELSVPVAAVAPTVALVLGAVGVLGGRGAVGLAFALGIVTLAGQGLRYARVERLGRGGTVLVVTVNVTLALVLVVLEVLVSH
jgi:hypothetical protein